MPIVDEFGREIQGSSFSARGPVPPSPSPSPPRDRGGRRPHHHHFEHQQHSDEEFHHHHKRRRRHSHHRRSPSPHRHRHSHRHRRQPQQHASEKYVKEPMLCEYVWKDQVEKKNKDKADASDANVDQSDEGNIQEQDTQQEETYDEYRQEYCLNYVRSFFNEHMDDSWFRKTYSPLEKKREMEKELERSADEAAAFFHQVTASPQSFIEQARLGYGTKETGLPPTRKRKYSDADAPTTSPAVNAVPQSHVLSTNEQTLVIRDIPPHVTDDQVADALAEHVSSPIKVFSSAVSSTTKPPLYRRAYCLLESTDARAELLENLKNAQPHQHHSHHKSEGGGQHVPRKEDDYMPKELDLDVDCSDPFGRVEVDEDGKGGGDGSQTVPQKKCIVVVLSAIPKQFVSVLSAAVSSTERIPRDKDAATTIARALDVSNSVPQDYRLDRILEALPAETPTEDLLDVSIAYLRRIHLFSFYNGCSHDDNTLGRVLSGQHAAGTIHLRLKGADEIMQKEQGEEEASATESKTTDMLVQRLDDSISKAIEASTSSWVGNTYVLDEEQDALAGEIQSLEEQTRQDWMANHGVVDEDGRARCSFHFCRKLFKDDSFLKKHLLKKHGEFLKAEQAKCHDSFMMKAWDEEPNRPVPLILVDCGANFGLVPAPVLGAQPMAEDPEPELWRREEDKRREAEEEKERRQERRDDYGGGPPRGPREPTDEPPRTHRPSNFVDVDDMQEEKVELSFENVEVVAPPPKKKKKKKKLL